MSELAPTVPLLHGAAMPRLGLGTWPMDDAEVERVLATAIELGYRSVDTAENYRNERGVGDGLRASGLPREELFVTTKLNKRWHGRDLVAQALDGSLERLGLDYVDLLLIHWPNPGQDRYVEAWEGLVALLETGRVRAIGTSNFKPAHLERIIAATGVAPDVNQIELSPLLTRDASRAFDAEHGIVTESWSPLGGGGARRAPAATGRVAGAEVRADAGAGRPPLAPGARTRDGAEVVGPGTAAAEPRDLRLRPGRGGRRRAVGAGPGRVRGHGLRPVRSLTSRAGDVENRGSAPTWS